MTTLYKGFDTQTEPHKFKLTDFELIKRDLLNHFNIRPGEKLMKPEFGCGVWAYVFEPMTEDAKTAIFDAVKEVVDYEPRVNAKQVIVDSYEQGIQIQLDLEYVGTDQTSTMVVRFDRNEGAVLFRAS